MEIVLISHAAEFRLASNSAHLVTSTLPDIEWLVYGAMGDSLRAWRSNKPTQSAVLFPSENSVELTPGWIEENQISCLVVPDGSWRQARKMVKRIESLAALPHVRLPAHITDGYDRKQRLRQQPHRGHLSTIESIALALGLVGESEIEASLLSIFDRFRHALRPEKFQCE